MKWGVQMEIHKDIHLSQCPIKTLMQYHLELVCYI